MKNIFVNDNNQTSSSNWIVQGPNCERCKSGGDTRAAGGNFILIDRTLRDEGTSYHYLPTAPFSEAPVALIKALDDGCGCTGVI